MRRIIKTLRINSLDGLNVQMNSIDDNLLPFIVLIYESQNNDISTEEIKKNIHRCYPNCVVQVINQELLAAKEKVCLEFHCYSELPDGINYIDGESVNGNFVNYGEAVYLCAVSKSKGKDKYRQCFMQLSGTMASLGFNFSNVVRQWNYIPNIIGFNSEGIEEYAQFNAARAEAYSQVKLEYFPAATGIGISGEEVIIIVYAQINCLSKVSAIENPLQISAYNYSANVLNRAEDSYDCPKPLFSRGLLVQTQDVDNLFVSGTASIRGEGTIAKESIIEQISKTIENINKLISQQNLNIFSAVEINCENELIPKFIRTYIREEVDYSIIENMIHRSYPQAELVLLRAAICRVDLLVEIEALI